MLFQKWLYNFTMASTFITRFTLSRLIFFLRYICTLRELGLAMIHAATKDYNEQIPEVRDIGTLAKIVKKPAISRALHSLNN